MIGIYIYICYLYAYHLSCVNVWCVYNIYIYMCALCVYIYVCVYQMSYTNHHILQIRHRAKGTSGQACAIQWSSQLLISFQPASGIQTPVSKAIGLRTLYVLADGARTTEHLACKRQQNHATQDQAVTDNELGLSACSTLPLAKQTSMTVLARA